MVKDWTPVLKEDIRQLYHVENRPLTEVMRLMKGRHAFIASERSYRSQLQKWGYMKYNTQSFKKTRPGSRTIKCAIPPIPPYLHATQPSSNLAQPSIEAGVIRQNDHPSNLSSGEQNLYEFDNLYFNSATTVPATTSNPQYMELGQDIAGHNSFNFSGDVHDADGKTPLHRAVIDKDTERVQSLLYAGVAISVKDHLRNEPLHYAVIADAAEIINLLLRFGADVNAKGQLGRAPLHLAVSSPETMKILVQQGAEASIQDDKGDTPLHLALSMQQLASADVLIGARCDLNKVNNANTNAFHRLLKLPCDNEACSRIKACLESGANIVSLFPDGTTPFQIFLSNAGDGCVAKESRWNWKTSKLDVFNSFLDQGASVTTPTKSGEPLIQYYFNKLHFRWNTDSSIGEKLCKLAGSGYFEDISLSVLHTVLAKCQKVSRHKVNMGKLVNILLQNGADPNSRNSSGQTPLLVLLTTKKNDPTVVKTVVLDLLAHGADPFLRDPSGASAFFEAPTLFPKNSEEIFRPILEADLKRLRNTEGIVEGDSDTPERAYWPEWEQAGRSASWSKSMKLILNSKTKFPSDVEGSLKASALAILAQEFIRRGSDASRDDQLTIKERRVYTAGILRDCRAHSVRVADEYYDLLLDLCQDEPSNSEAMSI